MGFEGQECLEYVRKSKILGINVTDNLKWSENTKYIVDKAMSRLWILRRMKNLGLDNNVIIDVYFKEIRSVLEFGVPVWNGGLIEEDSDKIENVQKKVFKILLNSQYGDYQSACTKIKVATLKTRRETISLKFAKKEYKKDISLFTKFTSKINTRLSQKLLVKEYNCNTDRFYRSSMPYLARLLNQNAK